MIQLYHGDALNTMRRFQANTFDAVITDPPYSSGGATLAGKQKEPREKYTNSKAQSPFPDFEGDKMDQRSWTQYMADVLGAARSLCRAGSVCVVFTDWRQYPSATDALQRAGWTWRGACVWDKQHTARPQKGRFRQQAEFILWASNGRMPLERPVPMLPGVFAHPNTSGPQRLHMTQKPVELMRSLVKICVPGGHILDPFAGSGSTLEAARLEGYHATGIELSRPISLIAARRLDISLA